MSSYTEEFSQVVRTDTSPEVLPKIFAFCNGGSHEWYNMVAIAEDGHGLAGHVCSHPSFGPHDMGVIGDWKHDTYSKHYPEGFEVVWVPDARNHAGLDAAYRKNQELRRATADEPNKETSP